MLSSGVEARRGERIIFSKRKGEKYVGEIEKIFEDTMSEKPKENKLLQYDEIFQGV